MGTEIERKFLVKADSIPSAEQSVELQQGYVGPEMAAVRVRLMGEKAFLTIKSAAPGLTRMEFEYPIPVEDAREILTGLCGEARVQKTRHYVPHEGHTWEVDEYSGKHQGLVVAEIELSSEEESFARPPWVEREVTDDRCYSAAALADGSFLTPETA